MAEIVNLLSRLVILIEGFVNQRDILDLMETRHIGKKCLKYLVVVFRLCCFFQESGRIKAVETLWSKGLEIMQVCVSKIQVILNIKNLIVEYTFSLVLLI